MNAMASELLSSMGVDIDPTCIVEQLSVAKQQIVEFAKVISRNIEMLVLDEPTSSLSNKDTQNLFALIRRMRAEKNLTVIFISHKLDEVIEISDRVSVLRNGVLVGTISGPEITNNNMINMMVGRDLANEDFYAPSVLPGEVVFSGQHLSRGRKFKDISFELRQGEIVGLFGLIGAGRTEMIQSIIGADSLDEGEMSCFGKRVRFKSPRESINAGISYLTENRRDLGLFMSKPLYDNIVASTLNDFTNKLGAFDNKKAYRRSEEYVRSLDINPADIRKRAINFSGGNQQKILFAKTLVNNPKILIVDEPTRGVDVGVKVTIHQMIRNLANQGMAILMISSELPEILKLSDKIMVMHEGQLKGILINHGLGESDIMKVAYRKEPYREIESCSN
jgi:ABC-type sugar transport system ATPase subunit